MKTVNVSGLKNNPTDALRKARHDIVVVMNRYKPDALLLGLGATGILDQSGVRTALAIALFSDGHLSLARSASLSAMSLAEFITHLSRLKIPVIRLDAEETLRDLDTLEQWIASS